VGVRRWCESGVWLLIVCALCLVRCTTGGNNGSLSTQNTPNPAEEQQAVRNVVALYRTALLLEDIDSLQTLLAAASSPDALGSVARLAALPAPRDTGLQELQAFRDTVSTQFRERTLTAIDIPDDTIQIAADRGRISFLEVISDIEAEEASDPTTLLQRTRAFRTAFGLTRDAAGDIVTRRIAT